MRIQPLLLVVAIGSAMTVNSSPLPQADYGGVSETPKLEGLNQVLGILQASTEKLTQLLQGKSRRDGLPGGDSDQGGGPKDPEEVNLQDTILSSVPELIPLLDLLGLNVGNH